MAETKKVNADELEHIADVLMGAAYADGEVDGREGEEIRGILAELVGAENIPESLGAHLDAFDHDAFDVDATCGGLHLKGADDRKALLALVARVTDADQIHDFHEDDYIRQVAAAIGAEPAEYENLTVELTWISSIDEEPPPLPV